MYELKALIVLCCLLNICKADFTTTIDLVSISDSDGTVKLGQPCSYDGACSLWVAVCVTSVESKSSCANNNLWIMLEATNQSLTTNQNSFNFSSETYGTWDNPKKFNITTDDNSAFAISFIMYNFEKENPAIIDEFSLTVTVADTYVNYEHQRQFSGPTNVQFSLPTGCENGGTFVGGVCVCAPHYTGDYCQNPICENGGIPAGNICTCPPTATGMFCENYLYQNCYDISTRGNTTSGVKTIYPLREGQAVAINVYCNDGWTIVQRRVDGSLDFGQGYADYAAGFGTSTDDGNFNQWLGNDNFYYLSQNVPMAIRFNMKYCGNGALYTSTYNSYTLGSADNYYVISISGYDATSTGGDGAAWFTGSQFSAYDNDHSANRCSKIYDNSGFWFSPTYCGVEAFIVPNLNGFYPATCASEKSDEGILWTPLTGNNETAHESLGYTSIEVIPSSAIMPPAVFKKYIT